ncbi:MAG: helix-turn-helix domain-containing protein, partial [Methylophilaceae bacterium]|nr:helix-turn-helix domain-containing protein [Methylophilaceae bacterium]
MGNYKQLSIEERSVIQAQLTLGFKPSWIAVGLGRSVSTIGRASLQWVSKRETWT